MKKNKNLLQYYTLACAFVIIVVSIFSISFRAKSQALIRENVNSKLTADIDILTSYLDGDQHQQLRTKYIENSLNEALFNEEQEYVAIKNELSKYKKSFLASNIFTLNYSEAINEFYTTYKVGDLPYNEVLDYANKNTGFFTKTRYDFDKTFTLSSSINGDKYYLATHAITRTMTIDNQPMEVYETQICILIPQSSINKAGLNYSFIFILQILTISIFFIIIGYYLARLLKIKANEFKIISYMAFYDSLTTLPNRAKLIEHVQDLVDQDDKNRRFAVIFIDIDRFKIVNDSEGHIEGDILLQKIALFLNSKLKQKTIDDVVNPIEIISRLGGDEFVIIYPYRNQETLLAFMNNILDEYKIFSANDELILKHKVTLSLGASVYPRDGETVSDLLKNADIAMYCAKRHLKTNCLIYNKTLDIIIEKNKKK